MSWKSFDLDDEGGGLPDEAGPGVDRVPDLLPFAGELDLAVLHHARELEDRFLDLVAVLLPRHHLERNLLALDDALQDRRRPVIEIHLPAQLRGFLRELESK